MVAVKGENSKSNPAACLVCSTKQLHSSSAIINGLQLVGFQPTQTTVVQVSVFCHHRASVFVMIASTGPNYTVAAELPAEHNRLSL